MRPRFDRRSFLFGSSAGLLLAGCNGSPSETGGGKAPIGTPGSGNGSGAIKVGIVTDKGGIGDLSFNWMAWQGLERAAKELGIEPLKIESQQDADYLPNLQRMAERGCNLVFAVGFALEPALKEIAPKYPDVRFAIIDSEEPTGDNIAGIVFREEEGAFLAGALGGGMSRGKKLGFVGGMEIPLIKRFEAGFRAGARTTGGEVTVTSKYTNNWEDVPKGKELALSLFSEGADVVMHASGRCGLGVIEAAREKGPGFWAIGVDADQDHLGTTDPEHPAPPSRVLTSMLKRVDNAVFSVVEEVATGKFKSGVRRFGVKENGVGISPLTYTRDEIPADLLAKVEKLKVLIAGGKFAPPKTIEELAGWSPPKV